MMQKNVKPLLFVLMLVFTQAAMMTLVPSGHTQQAETPLSVTQNGIAKMHELIANKTLNPDWAKSFSQLTVSIRNIKGFAEYVLKFSSSSGTPQVVTLYFAMNGQSTGSDLGD